ncbi:MAG: ribosome small subunit-dependent GTPase A [Cyanobacteria bacterium]|nr:ribosome small subunit-dependent GTPase A [Cyanobacteriota bacterium]
MSATDSGCAKPPGVDASPSSVKGRVVALEANFCRVHLDQPGPHGVLRLLCTRRTRLAKTGLQVSVGDRVGIEGVDWAAGRAAVASLEPRSSLLERPAVANVTQVLVVVALVEPELDTLQLTRFLVTAEAAGVPLQLVLSKADRLEPEELAAWVERLGPWGYDPLPVSTLSGQGIAALRACLVKNSWGGGIAVLCGPSGVGKSSLLNALVPGLALRVAAVSGRLQRGRHTTRHVELHALEKGSGLLVADTPGFNRPALPSDPLQLASAFPEIRQRLQEGGCRFANCRHLDDPGCRVGRDWMRHALYRRCLEEIDASPAVIRRSQGGTRQRGGREEPLLQGQWRQPSRRQGRQELAGEISPPDPEDSAPGPP